MGEPSSLRIGFHGGAGEVTGSRHLIEAGERRILLDCGLFQGHRQEALERNRSFTFAPEAVDAAVLSHAHIDHAGALPLLFKMGARAPVFCTAATHELSSLMLMDSARLQAADARFFNKMHAEVGETILSLYDEEDVRRCLGQMRPCEFSAPQEILPGCGLRFLNAGHVLGSAMVELDCDLPRGRRRVLFTGDLGRRQSPILEAPQPPKDVDYLLIESTYGGRIHPHFDHVAESFAAVIRRAVAEKGKILIPSFALERTQEIVFILEKLRRSGAVAPIPIYIDSPMASEVTRIFAKRLTDVGFSPAFKSYAAQTGDPFGMESLRYVGTKDESQALNELPGPLIIISASGMCEGGRILHHLRHNLGQDSTTILMVGHQAAGTLGRRLQDGARKVKIFGLEHEVWARVETMGAFSAHADQEDLLAFVAGLEPKPRRIFLVHGDPSEQAALAEKLKAAGVAGVSIPARGETVDLS